MNNPSELELKQAQNQLNTLKVYLTDLDSNPSAPIQQNSFFSVNEPARHHGLGFYALFAYSLTESFAGSYMFGMSILSGIKGISQATLMASSFGLGLLDIIPQVMFQYRYIGEALGIEFEKTEKEKLAEIYLQQLYTIREISSKLEHLNATKMTDEKIEEIGAALQAFIQAFNGGSQDIRIQKNDHEKLKYTLLIIGSGCSVISSYFMINLILQTLAADTIAKPLCDAIIIASIIINLFIYNYTNNSEIDKFLYPEKDIVKKLNDKIETHANSLNENEVTRKCTEAKDAKRFVAAINPNSSSDPQIYSNTNANGVSTNSRRNSI